jgi:hypothetical protein
MTTDHSNPCFVPEFQVGVRDNKNDLEIGALSNPSESLTISRFANHPYDKETSALTHLSRLIPHAPNE